MKILIGIFVLTMTSCASHFSAARSEEITPTHFVAMYHVDPLDQVGYCGSDSDYHYFFRGRPIGGGSFKIKKVLFGLPDEFPLSEARAPLLLVGHFDERTASWIQKEGFR
jgi:hypothetical protein